LIRKFLDQVDDGIFRRFAAFRFLFTPPSRRLFSPHAIDLFRSLYHFSSLRNSAADMPAAFQALFEMHLYAISEYQLATDMFRAA
jgi:hypothetical protein